MKFKLTKTIYTISLSVAVLMTACFQEQSKQPVGTSVLLKSVSTRDISSEKIVKEIDIDQDYSMELPDELITFSSPIKSGTLIRNSQGKPNSINLDLSVHKGKSVSYTLQVSAENIASGVELPISRKQSLIKISPLIHSGMATKSVSTAGQDLEIVCKKQKKTYSRDEAFETLLVPSDQEVNMQARKYLPQGTSVYRLKENMGTGKFTVSAKNIQPMPGLKYTIQVYEKGSPLVMTARANKNIVTPGSKLTVDFDMTDTEANMPVEMKNISGTLVSPAGKKIPCSIDAANKQATVQLDKQETVFPGKLWTVSLKSDVGHNTGNTKREVTTAVAYVVPTAKLNGTVIVNESGNGIVAHIGTTVGVKGRYEVRGILYGTNKQGGLEPVAIAHAAKTLTSGDNYLPLTFSAESLNHTSLSRPYEVKGLQLIHQDQVGTLHYQKNGFSIK